MIFLQTLLIFNLIKQVASNKIKFITENTKAKHTNITTTYNANQNGKHYISD